MSARLKDASWGSRDVPTYEDAMLGVLQDIRDELKQLNGLLGCRNFREVPQILRTVAKNTQRKKRKTSLAVKGA